jgi:hypothetical protein
MAWLVKALERKDKDGKPSGLWHLCAESDEGGGFYAGCAHDHSSAEEAQDCLDAKIRVGQMTGFPYDPGEIDRASEKKIKHMVDRFLRWKLPANFNPDGGITFKREYNDSPVAMDLLGLNQPMKHEPTGTNLLDATQSDAKVTRRSMRRD